MTITPVRTCFVKRTTVTVNNIVYNVMQIFDGEHGYPKYPVLPLSSVYLFEGVFTENSLEENTEKICENACKGTFKDGDVVYSTKKELLEVETTEDSVKKVKLIYVSPTPNTSLIYYFEFNVVKRDDGSVDVTAPKNYSVERVERID